MNCINCNKEGANEVVLGVVVCADCADIAKRALERAQRDADALVKMHAEAIRIAMIESRLRPEINSGRTDMPQVLREITKLPRTEPSGRKEDNGRKTAVPPRGRPPGR